MFAVVSVPAEEAAARASIWRAAVNFRTSDDEAEDETADEEAGPIALTLGREQPLLLHPVAVRRDASPRLAAGAEPLGAVAARAGAC